MMRSVISIYGIFLLILAPAMVIPAVATQETFSIFLKSAFMTGFFGAMLYLSCRPEKFSMRPRDTYILTAGTWIIVPCFAGLPFYFFGYSLVDSTFESISGITTTGSTVLSGLDQLPHSILLWRSILQWIGGIGIIVTSIAILPMLRIGGMQLFRTESSERADKELPRAASFAAATLWIYISLTACCAGLYLAAGMSPFDAVNHAMTTLSTGGYSTHDASMGYFENLTIHWIAIMFMAAGGIPFVMYIRLLKKSSLRSIQVETFVGLFIFITTVLTLYLMTTSDYSFTEAVTYAGFNIMSVITTTGYATTDYTLWGNFAIGIFFFATLSGACTGSTSGGIKLMRSIIIVKSLRAQFRKMIHPNGVFTEKYEDKPLSSEVIVSVYGYIAVFTISLMALTCFLLFCDLDFETALSGAATALMNVGPGIGDTIGPAGNFASLPDAAKWALSFGMLLGRLEFFTLLVILMPRFWMR